MKYLVKYFNNNLFFSDLMSTTNINDLEIKDNIKFMIKYCDTFLEYCHNENLSIDGNIAGEIIDSITEIEEYLENTSATIETEDLKEILENLSEIYYGLQNLNDIKLFNSIHIVYNSILKDTKEILEKKIKE